MNREDLIMHRQQRRPKQNWSFFGCLDCVREEGDADESTYSSFQSRKSAMNVRSSQQLPLRESQDIQPCQSSLRRSVQPSNMVNGKVSITKVKNRVSSRNISKTQTPYLRQEPIKMTESKTVRPIRKTLVVEPEYRASVNSERYSYVDPSKITTTMLNSSGQHSGRASLTFSYQRQTEPPTRYLQESVSDKRININKPSFLSPIKDELTNIKPTESPLSRSNNLQSTSQKSEDLSSNPSFGKKQSIVQPKQLNKKLSNFGNGKVNLKIRQTVSIADSLDYDSDHESFVIQNTSHEDLFRGMLKPIDQSQELENNYAQRSSMKLAGGRYWMNNLRHEE